MKQLLKLRKVLYKTLHPIKGEMWCLHRVVANRSLVPQNRELELTPSFLEQIIKDYIQNGYEFCSIDDLLYNHSPFDKKRVNISFDDGFVDIYQNAFPIFMKYHVPFTIYLTTDFADKKTNLWWIQLELIIWSYDTLRLSDGSIYEVANESQKIQAYERIFRMLMAGDYNAVDKYNVLFASYIPAFSCVTSNLVLSWDQILEMLNSGLCTIGSHTLTHANLTKLSEQELRSELLFSKERIEQQINQKVQHFSYPYSNQNSVVRRTVKEIGYMSAAMGYGGKIRKADDMFALNRVYLVEP